MEVTVAKTSHASEGGGVSVWSGAMTRAAQLHWCHTGCVCLCGSGVCGMARGMPSTHGTVALPTLLNLC